MKDNPRIMVFRLKELIYTGIFIILGILLIILMIYMFSSKGSSDKNASAGELSTTANDFTGSMKTAAEVTTPAETAPRSADEDQASAETTSAPGPESPSTAANQYIPGVYTSSLILNNSTLEIQVCVDSNHINSVSINNMDEAVTTMYPLMANSINDISNQIVNSQSLENITYTEDCRYTYIILLDAIATTLEKAKVQPAV
ncbi:MAG: hypothetical protein HFI34_03615 [Lachnospiraceae bacterium]|nr:hypothetical protein [Lachnospiraceae bacterium]